MKLQAVNTINYNGENYAPGSVFTMQPEHAAEAKVLIERGFSVEHVEEKPATKPASKKNQGNAAADAGTGGDAGGDAGGENGGN